MECECKNFHANFEFNNKMYCSRCYQKHSGILLHKFSFDDIDEILTTLKNVFGYNKLKNNILIKICKSEILSYDILEKVIYNINRNNLFFLSSEASTILKTIKKYFDNNKITLHCEHIISSKVLDYWNLDMKTHGVGECYYGHYEFPKKINEAILFVKSNMSSKYMYNHKLSKFRFSIIDNKGNEYENIFEDGKMTSLDDINLNF